MLSFQTILIQYSFPDNCSKGWVKLETGPENKKARTNNLIAEKWRLFIRIMLNNFVIKRWNDNKWHRNQLRKSLCQRLTGQRVKEIEKCSPSDLRFDNSIPLEITHNLNQRIRCLTDSKYFTSPCQSVNGKSRNSEIFKSRQKNGVILIEKQSLRFI